MSTATQPQAIGPAASKSQDRETFLRALYGAAEPGLWFVVSTFPDGVSQSFPAAESSIAKAADYIATKDDGTRHVFTSMAMFDKPITKGRGTAADAKALTCIWIDVDVKDTGSPTLDVARKIVDSIPIRPSLLTCSGAGLHAFYIFVEPLSLDTEGARVDTEDLLAHWKTTVMAYAAEQGGKVDKGTFDVARVMRVGGTFNPKTSPPLDAYIIECNDVRYNPSDFDEIMRDAPYSEPRERIDPVSLDGVEIRALDTLPPVFSAALENDTRLRRTWTRDRPDLVDQSSSGYSLSLANQCVALGMTDEQIAQVICTWRQQVNAAEKKAPWYANTIAFARKGKAITSETAQFIARAESDEVTDRQAILDGLSDLLGARIASVKQYPNVKRDIFRVTLEGYPERELGEARQLRDQKVWCDVFTECGKGLIEMKAPVWKTFCNSLLKVIEVMPDDVSESGEAEGWVREYLRSRELNEATTAWEAYEGHLPFRDREGRINIYFDDLLLSINRPGRKAVDKGRDYNPSMRSLGATTKYADLRSKGVSKARVWVLPAGFGDE